MDIQRIFDQALQLHQAGRVKDAMALYLDILPNQQKNAQLLYLVGTIYLQAGQLDKGVEFLQNSILLDSKNSPVHNNLAVALYDLKRLDEAVVSYDKAIALNPDYAEAYYNRGNALKHLKRLDQALESYDKAITLKPDYAEAYNNNGNALRDIKRLDEALASYDKAIALKPDYAEAYSNRSIALKDLKRLYEALESCDKAIALNPNYAEAYNNRGIALNDLKRLDEALASYDKAIAFNPDFSGAYFNRGAALKHLKRLDEALASYDKAIALNPDYPEAYYNRGAALKDLKRLDEALASYDKAIALKPDYAEAYCNRGIALNDLKRLDEALVSYDNAIALNPDCAEAYNNNGNALRDIKRLDEALASYDKAIALKPDYAEAYWNKSLLLILSGNYRQGWELYEWRLMKDDTKQYHYKFPQLSWRGQEDIKGKKILIHSEQGFGDVIQFSRYLTQVKSLGAEIIFEVPQTLVSFISTLNCDISLICKGGHQHPEFHAYCSVMSLPYVFKTTIETVPGQSPYLSADRGKVLYWEEQLGTKKRLRVGLVWSGSTGHKNDINRSIQLEQLSPLLDLPIELHSLQNEYRQRDQDMLRERPDIYQHQDGLKDFSDTAALVECMDLVISVDTSVAHVAGAIGKPVWILLPCSPDYRWMLDRDDSPWYPTARLFRQPKFDDWASVIQSVRIDLLRLLDTH